MLSALTRCSFNIFHVFSAKAQDLYPDWPDIWWIWWDLARIYQIQNTVSSWDQDPSSVFKCFHHHHHHHRGQAPWWSIATCTVHCHCSWSWAHLHAVLSALRSFSVVRVHDCLGRPGGRLQWLGNPEIICTQCSRMVHLHLEYICISLWYRLTGRCDCLDIRGWCVSVFSYSSWWLMRRAYSWWSCVVHM